MAKKFYPIKKKPFYSLFLLLTILWAAAGIITLLPGPSASKPSILGYLAHCSFAPASTLFCFAGAALTCLLRAWLFKTDSAGARAPFAHHLFALVPLAVLFTGGVAAAAVWSETMARFSAAEVAEISDRLPPSLRDGTYRGAWHAAEVEAEMELVIEKGRVAGGRLAAGKNVPERVVAAVLAALVERQSLAADAVTGATTSLSVVRKACAEALQKAAGK